MWPALMFAARRNDRVIGRTIIDDDSISTKNGLSQSGAPSGSKWAIVFLGDFDALDKINISHMGSPILSVNSKWLVILNVYGNSPIIFIVTIIKKIDGIIVSNGFKLIMKVRSISGTRILYIDIFVMDRLSSIAQMFRSTIIKKMMLVRNMIVIDGINLLNEAGSNDEKISGIMCKT